MERRIQVAPQEGNPAELETLLVRGAKSASSKMLTSLWTLVVSNISSSLSKLHQPAACMTRISTIHGLSLSLDQSIFVLTFWPYLEASYKHIYVTLLNTLLSSNGLGLPHSFRINWRTEVFHIHERPWKTGRLQGRKVCSPNSTLSPTAKQVRLCWRCGAKVKTKWMERKGAASEKS